MTRTTAHIYQSPHYWVTDNLSHTDAPIYQSPQIMVTDKYDTDMLHANLSITTLMVAFDIRAHNQINAFPMYFKLLLQLANKPIN